MPTVTNIFNEVTTEFTGGNDLDLITLNAATGAVSVCARVETTAALARPSQVQFCFLASPTYLTGLSIAQLKSRFNGMIHVLDVPASADVAFNSRESDVYSVSGLYFACWVETPDIASVKVSAWLAEF